MERIIKATEAERDDLKAERERLLGVIEEQARQGDHICYYSDLRRAEADYPGWRPEITLAETLDQLVESWHRRSMAEEGEHA